MERERWSELSAAVSKVDAGWEEGGRYTHRTAVVVRVHLWAVSHDRPVSWACRAENWDHRTRPEKLPDQSTMSRRTRGRHGKRFEAFLAAVGAGMNKGPLASSDPRPGAEPMRLVKVMDGKALAVAAHSKDRDARWGRGAGQKSNGYKLHLVRSDRPMPEQWAATPLDVDERVVARRMVKRLEGAGYLLRDGMYDASDLHDRCAAVGHRMLGPRRRPGTGLGHCYQSPRRVRGIETMEPPAKVNGFGKDLYRRRLQIERDLGNMASFGGGMHNPPPWVRRIWRLRNWVHAKLLVNAARIRCLRRRQRSRA
jgi:IS5 family transposase